MWGFWTRTFFCWTWRKWIHGWGFQTEGDDPDFFIFAVHRSIGNYEIFFWLISIYNQSNQSTVYSYWLLWLNKYVFELNPCNDVWTPSLLRSPGCNGWIIQIKSQFLPNFWFLQHKRIIDVIARCHAIILFSCNFSCYFSVSQLLFNKNICICLAYQCY